MNHHSPQRQSISRSFTRNEAAIIRTRLCIQPVSPNWRIAASTMGKPVRPSSSAILDAYVVPLCLERAKRGGIPACNWGISQGYVPLPAILYGLNYFATTSDFFVVDDNAKAKGVIKHITNIGKYPFCYQPIPPDAEIVPCVTIFGRTTGASEPLADLAARVYREFRIPLMEIISVFNGDGRLSAITPCWYSKLSREEKGILEGILKEECHG